MSQESLSKYQKIKGKLRYLDRSQLLYLTKKLDIKGVSQKKKNDLRKIIIHKLSELESKKTKKYNHNELNLIPVVQKSGAIKYSKKKEFTKTKSPDSSEPSYKNACFPKTQRLIAIGDLHGDLKATLQALKLANVISPSIPDDFQDITKIHWTGGTTYVVQLGDQIDRVRPSQTVDDLCSPKDPELIEDEGSDLKIMCLMDKLDAEARANGGRCISILGNHELMNVDSDFRYVSPREFREFGNYFKASRSQKNKKLPYGYYERKNAFSPGGILAKRMAHTRYSIVQVGSWIFVHGGIHPKLAENYTIDEVNSCISKWLLGYPLDVNKKLEADLEEIYHNEDDSMSPFWSRIYSDLEDYDVQSEQDFYKTLEILNEKNNRTDDTQIKGMIMGHSPQFMYNKGANSACNGKCWRIDVGMSRAFGELNQHDPSTQLRKIQLLEIIDDSNITILQ